MAYVGRRGPLGWQLVARSSSQLALGPRPRLLVRRCTHFRPTTAPPADPCQHFASKKMRWHRPLLGALAISGAAASSPRGGGGANSFSPIKELAPSLAASVAGGTIVAARPPPEA